MPELPEVETTLRGIEPHIINHTITKVIVRQARLRWPIPKELKKNLIGQTVCNLQRRGKYLLVGFKTGTLIIHLGMSGKLRILPSQTPAGKHDHFDIIFHQDYLLRFNDPRRFGAILWTPSDPLQHPLLKKLGPEPLTRAFHPAYLHQQLQQRNSSIKTCIMDNHIVVGVGNIYANEALFLAHIHPERSAKTLTFADNDRLVKAIKVTLRKAIQAGGTTLKDFLDAEGKPGYFSQQLLVYGRAGLACTICQTTISLIRQTQRASYFCKQCQH